MQFQKCAHASAFFKKYDFFTFAQIYTVNELKITNKSTYNMQNLL